MYGYKNVIRLIGIEFFVMLALHVLYAYITAGSEVGKLITIMSAFAFFLMSGFAIACRNKRAVVCFFIASVAVAVSVFGYILKTLHVSCLVFAAVTLTVALYLDIVSLVAAILVSVACMVVYGTFFSSVLYEFSALNPVMLWWFMVMVYVFIAINILIFVRHSVSIMAELDAKAIEANKANEAKMRFLSNISHEIRTPMNAICGMAELNLRDDSLTPNVRENTESIQTAGRILISIVNDILDYSKLESGKLEIIHVSYSLRVLLEDMVNMMRIRLEDKDVELKYSLQEDIPDILYGDELRIRQILFNLLSNAVKFTEKGFITLDVSGVAEDDRIKLKFVVTDSGIGIKKDDLSSIFTGFMQFDSHKSNAREGTGLGLAVCKQLILLMNGEINVESSYGVGSRFTVELLQYISTDDKELKHYSSDSVEPNARVNAPSAKVLVVDDNGVNLKVAKGLLQTFGVSVDTCMSGAECLELLKSNRDYDIVFLDHMMPELDGIETLKLMRSGMDEYMQNVTVIALTANVASGIRQMFMAEGFDDYVSKPIDIVWLNGILRKYIPADKQI